MNELVMKDRAVLFAGEVAALASPLGDGRRDAADQLAHAGFTFRSALFAVEILRGDDVCGRHGPGLRYLDVLLLEDDFTRLARNRGRPVLPFHRVIRRDAFPGEIAPE